MSLNDFLTSMYNHYYYNITSFIAHPVRTSKLWAHNIYFDLKSAFNITELYNEAFVFPIKRLINKYFSKSNNTNLINKVIDQNDYNGESGDAENCYEYKSIKNVTNVDTYIFDIIHIIFIVLTKIILLSLIFLCVYITYKKNAISSNKNYYNFILTAIINCLSYYEIVATLASFLLLLILSVTISCVNDDFFDVIVFLMFFFVVITVLLYFYNIGVIKSYYILTSNSTGSTIKRTTFDDLINIFLCILRIFLCWSRYIFYDLQIEFVDLTLNYTEDMDADVSDTTHEESLAMLLIYKIFDLFTIMLSIIVCLVKLVISLFLMWLIIDLFILRIGININEEWLIRCVIIIVKNEFNLLLKKFNDFKCAKKACVTQNIK